MARLHFWIFVFLAFAPLQEAVEADCPALSLEEALDEDFALAEESGVNLLQAGARLSPQAQTYDTKVVASEASGKTGGGIWKQQQEPNVDNTSTETGNDTNLTANDPSTSLASSNIKFSACAAEFIAMTLFVVIGCGSAMGIAKEPGSAWVLQVSLTFGVAITALAYAIGHYSGGQINCAVTLGLVIIGNVTWAQGLLNFVAQLLGSVFGAILLTLIYPADKDLTGGMGSNDVGPDRSVFSALLGEVLMTFLLVYVVLETAVNPAAVANRELACVAIGFAVFLAHSVLVPIDGCSINPTRSFGPDLIARLRYGKGSPVWFIFWIGPLAGAAIAAGIYQAMRLSGN